MTSAARYSTAYARMHALKSRLWTPLDRPLLAVAGITPGGRAVTADPEAVWPDLVRWYSVLIATYRSAAPLLEALIRRHEVENLKLLWRAAVRRRVPPHRSWRPLGLLGVITFSTRLSSPEELVHRLDSTPYSSVARTLLRTHGTDLPATEIGLDRWVWNRVWTEAERLPRAECDAVRLVRLLVMDSDVELLRRGTIFGLEADLVAKSTVMLSQESRIAPLAAAAAWRPGDGPLARVLPRSLSSIAAGAADWDEVVRALRAARLRACRRAFVGWPFRLAPALAALMLREEQSRAAMSIAAAREAGGDARQWLPLALAASALEG